MNNTIFKRLRASVVPRIKLDLNVIETRYKKQKSKKDKGRDNTSEISPQAKEYLNDIFEDPDVPLTARGDRLGYNAHMTNKVKNELIKKGLVEQYEVNLGRTNKFLDITEKGCTYLKVAMPRQRGRGSREHKYWQRRLSFYHRNTLGHTVKIEGDLNGKSADVAVIEEDGRMLAVEIAITPKNEIRNIKEDLAVGFDKVLVACRNKKVKQEIERKLKGNLNTEDRLKVEICLLTDFI